MVPDVGGAAPVVGAGGHAVERRVGMGGSCAVLQIGMSDKASYVDFERIGVPGGWSGDVANVVEVGATPGPATGDAEALYGQAAVPATPIVGDLEQARSASVQVG